jgi:hypothetical protein
MGDAKSNDTLTCRIPHYEQPRMSRACYTSFADCCKHNHQCTWVEKEDQEELSERSSNPDSAKDKEFLAELKSVSTIRCQSSLFKMDFGSNIYGQFRACTVDPMHLFEGGWCTSVAKLSSVLCVLGSDWNWTYYWSVFGSHQGPVYATDSLE